MDGAGVHLQRILGHSTTESFDPFLMMDLFDSTNPQDYIKGFPTHPHRGIETITYLIKGEIDHKDSMGNRGKILDGEAQWMTAGKGILHEEMPQESDHMLGFQLWLNLPKEDKMSAPNYHSLSTKEIPEVENDQATLHIISGSFENTQGFLPTYVYADVFDIELKKNQTIRLDTHPENTAYVVTMEGEALINDQIIADKSAILFDTGNFLEVSASFTIDILFSKTIKRAHCLGRAYCDEYEKRVKGSL